MAKSYDIVIAGGAVVGSSTAFFLASNPEFKGSVLVVERDWTYANTSTARSNSSTRTQYSNALNVQMSQFGVEVIRQFPDMVSVGDTRPDVNFHEHGYLFLASTDEQERVLRENHETQVSCGADVVLLTPDQLKDRFPYLNVEDLRIGSFGQSGEGWFDNTGLMYGFRNKAIDLGVEYIKDEVVNLYNTDTEVQSVQLASGEIVACGAFINATGPRAARTAAMAGLNIPVEPRKRSLFVLNCANPPKGRFPFLIDSSGVFVRAEGQYFVAGAPVPEEIDMPAELDDFDARHYKFEEVIWPALYERCSNFEALKLQNFWAGHYAYNTLDQNMILGPHTQIKNFYFANGFSGHGLQHSAAVGRGMSELLTYGCFQTLDLSPFGYDRIERNEPFLENTMI